RGDVRLDLPHLCLLVEGASELGGKSLPETRDPSRGFAVGGACARGVALLVEHTAEERVKSVEAGLEAEPGGELQGVPDGLLRLAGPPQLELGARRGLRDPDPEDGVAER